MSKNIDRAERYYDIDFTDIKKTIEAIHTVDINDPRTSECFAKKSCELLGLVNQCFDVFESIGAMLTENDVRERIMNG